MIHSCPNCGAHGAGRFCAECGIPIRAGAACRRCDAALKPGAAFCGSCGEPLGAALRARKKKTVTQQLPWLLSAAVLIGFSFIIAFSVQRESVVRTGEMTMTGGLPGEGAPAAGGNAGMPTAEELEAMTPRQAADRLFERVMLEHEGGNFEQTAFFIEMALRAYQAVPPSEVDPDMLFHMGLLWLLTGEAAQARELADEILQENPEDLLGLLLASRIANFEMEPDLAAEYRGRIQAVIRAEGGIPGRPDYQAHRALIERALSPDSASSQAGTSPSNE